MIKMDTLQVCRDTSDIRAFFVPKGLFLKPVASINISVQIPCLRSSGCSISSKTLMENIISWAAPDVFCSLKVSQSTVEFIRFEGEIENKLKIQAVLNRLNGKVTKLPSFPEQLKVRASLAKPNFPNRHEWDSFFRDEKNMNEMKAGERPDTLYLSELPVRWFASSRHPDKPSEKVLCKVFEQFGEIRAVDIPTLDPFRGHIKSHISGLKTFSFNQHEVFDAYIQFKDYGAFVRAMDTLRGMKLLKKDSDKAFVAHFKVTFDKTKHLSDNSIRKRNMDREKILLKLKEKDIKLEEQKEDTSKGREKIEIKKQEMKFQEANKEGTMKKERDLKKVQKLDVSTKIVEEEKLLMFAQRKLESIHLLSELLRLLKEKKEKEKSSHLSSNEKKLYSARPRNKEKITQNNGKQTDKNKQNQEERKYVSTKLKGIESIGSPESELFSESSVDNYEDRTEPLVIRRSNWKGPSNFVDDQRWRSRRRQYSGRWSRPMRGNRNLCRQNSYNKNNEFSQYEVFYSSAEHNMYYKYFKSICKKDVSRSRSSSVKSRSRSSSLCRKPERQYASNSRGRFNNYLRSEKISDFKSYSRHSSHQTSKEQYFRRENSQHQKRYGAVKRDRKSRWDSMDTEARIMRKDESRKSYDRFSIHTWSRSPSKDREPSWERRCEFPDFEDKLSGKIKH